MMRHGVLIYMRDLFLLVIFRLLLLKMKRALGVEYRGCALLSGQVQTHFRAPRDFHGFPWIFKTTATTHSVLSYLRYFDFSPAQETRELSRMGK